MLSVITGGGKWFEITAQADLATAKPTGIVDVLYRDPNEGA